MRGQWSKRGRGEAIAPFGSRAATVASQVTSLTNGMLIRRERAFFATTIQRSTRPHPRRRQAGRRRYGA